MHFPKFLKLGAVPALTRNKTTNEIVRSIRSLDYKMADILAAALDFSYEIVPNQDGEYGRSLDNDSFTGLVGQLQRGEADIAVTSLGITLERGKVVGFSHPHFVDSFTFATLKPELSPRFLTIVYPFTFNVWISILTCLVAMSFVFYVLLRKKYSYQESLLKTFGSFLGQSSFLHSRRLSRRLLFLSWAVGAMITTCSYTAVLLAFLTLPITERGIRTIADLAEAVAEGRYQSSTYRGNFIPDVLLKAEEPSLRLLGSNVKGKLIAVGETMDTVLHSEEKIALIAPRSLVSFLEKRCFISEDNLFPVLLTIAYKKSFCCPRQLEMASLRITASGLYTKIRADGSFKDALKLPPEYMELSHTLSIIDMSGAFSFLLLGYILSSVVCLAEMLVGKRKSTSNTKKHYFCG